MVPEGVAHTPQGAAAAVREMRSATARCTPVPARPAAQSNCMGAQSTCLACSAAAATAPAAMVRLDARGGAAPTTAAPSMPLEADLLLPPVALPLAGLCRWPGSAGIGLGVAYGPCLWARAAPHRPAASDSRTPGPHRAV